MKFNCPICKKNTATGSKADLSQKVKELKFFPFCSERCKFLDTGAWLDSNYRVPVKDDEQFD
jgi:endogenous inhibitor of DNA gyrase (YacG/DUF329 family)